MNSARLRKKGFRIRVSSSIHACSSVNTMEGVVEIVARLEPSGKGIRACWELTLKATALKT